MRRLDSGFAVASSSVSEAVDSPSSEDSHARAKLSRNSSPRLRARPGLGRRDGMVTCVCSLTVEWELLLLARLLEAANEGLAADEAKEDSAVGGTGSGTTVLRNVCQGRFDEVLDTLLLRSRSPRPSTVETGDQDSRREEAGSGPSAILRWPTRRRGGWETALASRGESSVVSRGESSTST